MYPSPLDALIVIDVQNDFLPGGTLAVPEADSVVGPCNALLGGPFAHRVLTQDWHPPGHISFAPTHDRAVGTVLTLRISPSGVPELEQLLWPTHCVANTRGADFDARLDTDRADLILRKGTNPRLDAYSAFFDNDRRRPTGLHGWLSERRVRRVFLAGLARDVCVCWTARDALALGYAVVVVDEATRPVDPNAAALPPEVLCVGLSQIDGLPHNRSL